MLVIRWKKNFELVNSVLEDMEKTQGLRGCRAAIGAFQLNVLILVLCRFCFSIDSGRKLYFRPSFRPISLNWLFDQESAPVPKQTKTATMKVLYVLDVQQLHTFDELSISFCCVTCNHTSPHVLGRRLNYPRCEADQLSLSWKSLESFSHLTCSAPLAFWTCWKLCAVCS